MVECPVTNGEVDGSNPSVRSTLKASVGESGTPAAFQAAAQASSVQIRPLAPH